MIKKINLFLIMFITFISVNSVNAYEIPSGSYYANVDTSIGNIDIWFPADKIQYLIYDSEMQIINVGSSNITGYVNNGSNELTITFPVFDKPYYRENYSNVDLNITNLVSTNIDFMNSDSQIFINDTLYNQILIITISLGVVGLWLMLFKK